MKQCAFLSMADLEAFECYDHLLYQPLADRGWEVFEVPWQSTSVNWDRFDAVVIRSPWDYQDYPAPFMQVLETIHQSSARLENSLAIVKWNLDKRYLREIRQKGIEIVPTHWQDRLQPAEIPSLFDARDTNELIIKPVISAGADHTYRVGRNIDSKLQDKIESVFANRPLMIQPFMDSIVSEGEYSLFYFAGQYSHAILKVPAKDDFRVQEEHGGSLEAVQATYELRSAGDRTMRALPELPLYARIDFVRTSGGDLALIEIELIEPSLYFNMDPESPQRFAREFDEWMRKG
jgi:glutathione synthase/RimK-type ligase-like ATP-grasp enzyme